MLGDPPSLNIERVLEYPQQARARFHRRPAQLHFAQTGAFPEKRVPQEMVECPCQRDRDASCGWLIPLVLVNCHDFRVPRQFDSFADRTIGQFPHDIHLPEVAADFPDQVGQDPADRQPLIDAARTLANFIPAQRRNNLPAALRFSQRNGG